MVHHVYHVENGCLVRFSLLPGGAVKKAQVLDGKLRLMAFEWTHLASPREVYETMVEKMELKVKHPKSERELREEVYRRYGFSGRVGWLHPGLTLPEMEGVIGSKSKPIDGGVKWNARLGDYAGKIEVELKEGKMVRLLSEGPDAVSEVPLSGTLSWIEKAISGETGRNRDPLGEEDEEVRKPLVSATDEEILAALEAYAKEAKPEEWYEFCSYASEMVNERGVKSDTLLQVVVERAWVSDVVFRLLQDYKYADLNSWVEKGLTTLLPEAPLELEPRWQWDNPLREKEETLKGLLSYHIAINRVEGEVWVSRFLYESEQRWGWALLGITPLVTPELGQKILEENLKFAVESERWWVASEVFGQLGFGSSSVDLDLLEETDREVKVVDKVSLLELVEQTPVGKPGEEWHERRSKVLEFLNTE